MDSYLPSLADYELVVRSPGRINLIGEHTDYNGGFCLPAAIQQSLYIGLNTSSKTQFNSLNYNELRSIDNLNQCSWGPFLLHCLEFMKSKGFEIPPFNLSFGGDLPIGAGLSSSSALCCGFLFALNDFFQYNISLEDLTKFAVYAEQGTGVIGGMMDQISILNGIKDHALFIDCSTWNFKPVAAHLKNYCWLVIDTGIKHHLIDTDYNQRSRTCSVMKSKLLAKNIISNHLSELQLEDIPSFIPELTELEIQYLEYVLEENNRVQQFVTSMNEADVRQLGTLLFESHQGLRFKYKVSCKELDLLVDFAMKDDRCFGARMMGGGFGGSTLHLVNQHNLSSYLEDISQHYKSFSGFVPNYFVATIENGVQRIQ